MNIVEFGTLYMLRNHIHPDLKSEYMLEEDPQKVWDSMGQCYEQQKTIVIYEVPMSGTKLHIRNFKYVDACNYVVHKISHKLRLFDKEPSNADKIEKIF